MVTDLIIRIKNAQAARKESLKVPFSNLNFAVSEILAKNNYVESAAKKGRMPKRIIEIKLKYDKDGKGAISGVKLLSVPSRQLYKGYKKLTRVLQGYGLGVVSTPKGLMTNQEAKKSKVGGQLLCEIW